MDKLQIWEVTVVEKSYITYQVNARSKEQAEDTYLEEGWQVDEDFQGGDVINVVLAEIQE